MEQKGKLPVFKERLFELMGDRTITDFAQSVGLTRQTLGFYLNGDRIPDAKTLKQICEKCNVSSDYLLGLSEVKSPDATVQGICEYTGLSEQAIATLQLFNVFSGSKAAKGVNALLFDSTRSLNLCYYIANAIEAPEPLFTNVSELQSYLSAHINDEELDLIPGYSAEDEALRESIQEVEEKGYIVLRQNAIAPYWEQEAASALTDIIRAERKYRVTKEGGADHEAEND